MARTTLRNDRTDGAVAMTSSSPPRFLLQPNKPNRDHKLLRLNKEKILRAGNCLQQHVQTPPYTLSAAMETPKSWRIDDDDVFYISTMKKNGPSNTFYNDSSPEIGVDVRPRFICSDGTITISKTDDILHKAGGPVGGPRRGFVAPATSTANNAFPSKISDMGCARPVVIPFKIGTGRRYTGKPRNPGSARTIGRGSPVMPCDMAEAAEMEKLENFSSLRRTRKPQQHEELATETGAVAVGAGAQPRPIDPMTTELLSDLAIVCDRLSEEISRTDRLETRVKDLERRIKAYEINDIAISEPGEELDESLSHHGEDYIHLRPAISPKPRLPDNAEEDRNTLTADEIVAVAPFVPSPDFVTISRPSPYSSDSTSEGYNTAGRSITNKVKRVLRRVDSKMPVKRGYTQVLQDDEEGKAKENPENIAMGVTCTVTVGTPARKNNLGRRPAPGFCHVM